jgi:hypothetical protein
MAPWRASRLRGVARTSGHSGAMMLYQAMVVLVAVAVVLGVTCRAASTG